MSQPSTPTTKPFEQLEELDDRVQFMRPVARLMLLSGHPDPVDDLSLLPGVVREHARIDADSIEDRSLFEQLSRMYLVSFALGIAIGQLAPWIGEGGRR